MSSERSFDDIPSAPRLAAIAQGVSDGGKRWTVRAGGTRAQCWTFMDIELPDGRRVGGGGFAGPALPVGRRMNCSVHQSDTNVRYLVGRVHPTVKRLRLEFAADYPADLDLQPVGESAELGVAFMAEILPSSAELINISAWDESGRCVDEQNTANYMVFFNQARPDSAVGDLTDVYDSSWDPPDHRS